MRSAGRIVILVLFFVYLFLWVLGNQAWLFDLSVQHEDAGLFLAPFHWLSAGGSQDLPLFVEESRFLIPPAFEILYQGMLLGVDLPVASKIVQILCLLLIFASGVVFWRSSSPRNLSTGLFFIFLMMHTSFVINRMAGGLPRAFCFPLLALWGAGRLAQNHKAVLTAGALGALFYPPVVIMILMAETLFFFCAHRAVGSDLFRKWVILVITGFLFLIPFLIRQQGGGFPPSFSEARKNHAFYVKPLGKEGVFPIRNPGISGFYFTLPLTPVQGEPFKAWPGRVNWEYDSTYALIFYVILILLVVARTSAPPRTSLLFLTGSLICYVFSMFFGLYLYWPETYLHYGIVFSGILLVVEILKELKGKDWIRDSIVLFFALLVLLLTGNGTVAGNGMNMNENYLSSLYSRIRQLPDHSLIAAHPVDADDIPYFTNRAVVINAKTLQPLFKGVWEAQKKRTFGLLDSLYARDPMVILAFCRQFGVTHFLVNSERYGPDFLQKLRFMEPFDSALTLRLGLLDRASPVWESIPSSAVEFEESGFVMVNVKKLFEAWGYPLADTL